MADRWVYDLSGLEPLRTYRIDTASGSTSAATIYRPGTDSVIAGAIVKANDAGSVSRFEGTVGTLYAKALNERGAVVGSPVTVTGRWSPQGRPGVSLGIYYAGGYGVAGDNATVTDGDAVQETIDKAPAGATVVVRGQVKVKAQEILVDGDTVYDFQGASFTPASGANLRAVIMSRAAASDTSTTFDTNITIIGGYIDGNMANQTSGAGEGIRLAAGRSRIVGMNVHNTRSHGFVWADVNNAGTLLLDTVTGVENRMEACRAENNGGTGIWVLQSGSNRLTDGYMVDCIVSYPRHNGIRVDSSGGWHIINPHVYGAGLSGIVMKGGYASYCTDAYIEGVGILSEAGGPNPTTQAFDLACPDYAGGSTYVYNQVVYYSGALYISTQDANTGNQPDTSPSAWRPYVLPGASVAGLACVDMNSGRATVIRGPQISLGHDDPRTLHIRFGYRGMLFTGPNSGTSKGNLILDGFDVLNEKKPGGTNTIGIRIATNLGGSGTGGVQLLREPKGTVRGQWTTTRSIEQTCRPTIAITVGGGLGTGATAPTLDVNGTDYEGEGQLNAGTAALAAGKMATVTFSSAHSIAPTVNICPAGATSHGLHLSAVPTTTGFDIYGDLPASGTSYGFRYSVVRRG